MSKFEDSILKVGDKVMLSPESGWVDSDSDQPNSANPTGVIGEITKEHNDAHEDGTLFHWHVKWNNNTYNSYHSEDLILVAGISVGVETSLHKIIEELESHVETLEDALDEVTKELLELREKQNSSEFKPICDMTMENWEQALEGNWQFEMRGVDRPVVVIELDHGPLTNYPVRLNYNGIWVTKQGYRWRCEEDRSVPGRNVTKRIK